MQRRWFAWALLIVFDLVLVWFAFTTEWSQDLLPYLAAAELLLDGQAEHIMLPPDAWALMDSDPEFIERALAIRGKDASYASGVTGFVSPPPSVLPAFLLIWMPYTVAEIVCRLALAVLCGACAHLVVWKAEPARRPWVAGMFFVLLPACAYAVSLGQSSVLWLVGATLTLHTPGRRAGAAAGAAVGLLTLFKITPVLVLGALFAGGQRRRALVGTTVVVVLSLISLPLSLSLWSDFFVSAVSMSQRIMPYWSNLALDASLVRLLTQDPHPLPIIMDRPAWTTAVVWIERVGLLGLLGYAAWKRRDRVVAVAWVVALLLSPFLWLHYAVVFPALLAARRVPPRLGFVLAALIGLVELGVFHRAPMVVVSNLGVLTVHLAAIVILFFMLSAGGSDEEPLGSAA